MPRAEVHDPRDTPLRVALVIHSLGCGGAEKVAVRLARHLRETGHDPVLVTLDDGARDFHETPAGVERMRA